MPMLLALVTSLLWGGSDFAGGTLSRRLPALAVVCTSQLMAGVALAVAAVVFGQYDAGLDYLPWAVAAGLVGAASLVAFYAALAAGTMGVVAPIAALGAVVPVFAGLLGGERPAREQLVGIAVAVVGVMLASGPELSGAAGPRPVLLAVLAAVGFGSVLLLLAHGSDTNPFMTVVAMRAASVPVLAVLVLVSLAHGQARARPAVRDLPLLAAVGCCDAGANLAFGFASRGELISIVSVLGSLYPVVTVLLARAVHGERLARAQNVGVVLALGGVVLIASG